MIGMPLSEGSSYGKYTLSDFSEKHMCEFLVIFIDRENTERIVQKDEGKEWRKLFLTKFKMCFPGGSVVKNLPASVGDAGLVPESGRSPGEGKVNCSSILAWKIPWTEEPGGLLFTGSRRVRHKLAIEQQQKHLTN